MERKPRKDRNVEKEFEERVVTINRVTKVVRWTSLPFRCTCCNR